MLYSIQLLRAMAACSVVLLHAQTSAEKYALNGEESGFALFRIIGPAGVDLFFVISGFIMMATAGETFGKPRAARSFMIRRIIRIAPIYWFYTSIMVLLLAYAPALFGRLRLDAWHVVASYLFIPAYNNAGELVPVVNVGWTLSFEMYFYAVFACFLPWPSRYFLPGLTLFFGASAMAGLAYSGQPPIPAYIIANPLLLEFLFGCYLGALFQRRLWLSSKLSVLAILAFPLWLVAAITIPELQSINRVLLWGVPCAGLLFSWVSLEQTASLRIPRPFVSIGSSSYSLYLSHIFVLPATGKLWNLFGFKVNAGIYVVCAVAACVIAAHIGYLFLEKPITRALQRRFA